MIPYPTTTWIDGPRQSARKWQPTAKGISASSASSRKPAESAKENHRNVPRYIYAKPNRQRSQRRNLPQENTQQVQQRQRQQHAAGKVTATAGADSKKNSDGCSRLTPIWSGVTPFCRNLVTHFSTAVASVRFRYEVPLDDISSTPVVMRKNMGLEGTGQGKSTCCKQGRPGGGGGGASRV